MTATPTHTSPTSMTEAEKTTMESIDAGKTAGETESASTGPQAAAAAATTETEARKDSVPEVDLTKDIPEPTPSNNQGTKRTHEDSNSPPGFDDPEIHLGQLPITDSCQVIRNKIHRLIESGEMKVGEFCKAIGVSNGAYNNFLHKNGTMAGVECAAYANASAFFQNREAAGLKLPAKKQKTKEDVAKAQAEKPDLDDVHLDGEETDSVPVYDTCDDIRRQITAYLKKPGVTQAQFCRDIHAQYHTEKAPKSITSSQLQSFRGKKGPDAGNTSSVFYAAYVFFEKLRIKQNKHKSEKRKEMEEIWGSEGFDIEHNANSRGITCIAGSSVWKDKYGKYKVMNPDGTMAVV